MPQARNVLEYSLKEFINATAAKTSTPGGGSVAGVVGALAVALGEMTLNFSRGKKKLAQFDQYHAHLAQRLLRAREMFCQLVSDDIAAFEMYQQTRSLPDGPEKEQQAELATAAAIDVPRQATKLALALLADMRELADKCNQWLITDLLAAGALAVAVATLSHYNVQINLPHLSDRAAATDIAQGSKDDLARARSLQTEIEQAAEKYLN